MATKLNTALDREFTAVAAHAFNVHLHFNLEAGVTDFHHASDQLND
jgi:hypothetical protein